MFMNSYTNKFSKAKYLACSDCFAHKETLKSLGFRWNAGEKEWQKDYTSKKELVSLFIDVAIACNLSFSEFEACYDRIYGNGFEAEDFDDTAIARLAAQYPEI